MPFNQLCDTNSTTLIKAQIQASTDTSFYVFILDIIISQSNDHAKLIFSCFIPEVPFLIMWTTDTFEKWYNYIFHIYGSVLCTFFGLPVATFGYTPILHLLRLQ